MSKTARNFLIATLISIITLLVVLKFSDFSKTVDYIVGADPVWLLTALLMTILTWTFETLTIKVFAQESELKISFAYLFRITLIGRFFSAITPFYTGGQPAQVAYMAKDKHSAGIATSMLVSRFVVYQIVITIFGVAGMLAAYSFVSKEISNLALLAIVGFLINSGVLVFLFLFSLNKKFAGGMAKLFFDILARLRLIKNSKTLLNKLFLEVDKFHNSMKKSLENTGKFFAGMLFAFLQMLAFISTPYFVALAVGINVDYLRLISVQLVLFLISSMIPTPGASGASEGVFVLFFASMLNEKTAAVMILWRLFTYYINIIVGGFFSFLGTKQNTGITSHQ
ncbi:lysylphosphatidylglycerol synthase transmembrane domain-containing protein [Kosmotoga pacifica]|uniref:Lysylphosphatidylglycerol synthetase n=1 Tax=Kosmotoga pacifica TaxID=1330330 RepID=A0A0G2ZD79_9BACT|nr:lysylphosphatidylglycerol synthase transmembrane domain-containing protein [Kosmotoga pacifica]AKI98021.1 hypothetical protein IX53_09495 [Kosmotoga pacifica]